MIKLTCDNCDREFEADEKAPEGKSVCPYCGDVNRLPAAATAPVGVPVAAAPGAASASAAASSSRAAAGEAERELVIVRTAMFRAHPFLFLLMIVVLLGGIVLAILARPGNPQGLQSWMMWAGIACSALALLWWLGWWLAPHRWVKLVITNKRTIRQEGIIMRKTSEVLHHDVRNFAIEQSLIGRLLNVGSIEIDSAGGDMNEGMIEIRMKHVPKPYEVKAIIDKHRKL